MFLFNPESMPVVSLADQLRREIEEEMDSFQPEFRTASNRPKKVNRTNRVKIVDGIPYQTCGGGRRRLPVRSNY